MKNALEKYKTKEELLEDIRKEGYLSIKFAPISYYVKVLRELGFKRLEKLFDTNGWQIDFWTYFTDGENTLMISGSLYNGQFKLTIDND